MRSTIRKHEIYARIAADQQLGVTRQLFAMSPKQHRLLGRAAAIGGQTIEEFVIASACEKADKVLAENPTIEIDGERYLNVYEALGYEDATGMQTKARIATRIREKINHHQLSMVKAAEIAEVSRKLLPQMFRGQFCDMTIEQMTAILDKLCDALPARFHRSTGPVYKNMPTHNYPREDRLPGRSN